MRGSTSTREQWAVYIFQEQTKKLKLHISISDNLNAEKVKNWKNVNNASAISTLTS